jgi:hypothetical protein
MKTPQRIGFFMPSVVQQRQTQEHTMASMPAILKNDSAMAVFGGLPVKTDNGERSLSLYNDAPAGEADWAVQALRITSVFPEAGGNAPFMAELSKAVVRKKMTARQLSDAVDNLIETCKYPRFSIAEVVGYDKKVRLYDYDEYCGMCHPGMPADTFESVQVDDVTYFAKKADLVNARNGISTK